MADTRTIRKVLRSRPTVEGAGVHLRRAFAFDETGMFDPFLLLDDFRGDDPALYRTGFPWHPHRGIETITYVLAGAVAHGDSMGNRDVIGAGDVQWMTAGSGIVHEEMPAGDPQGRMYGFQLWSNLPARDKMMAPRYQGVRSAEIPEVAPVPGVRARVICGAVAGISGPVRDIVTEPTYLDVSVAPSTRYVHSTPRGHTVLAYVIDGRGEFCSGDDPFSYAAEGAGYFDSLRDGAFDNGCLVVFGDGDQVEVRAAADGIRFLLLSGKPIREPVAWYGPIVMNTQEELRTAFRELRSGTFIKHP